MHKKSKIKYWGGIIYLVFSLSALILNFLIGYGTINEMDKLFLFIVIPTVRFTNGMIAPFILLSLGLSCFSIIYLGIFFGINFNNKNKKKYLFYMVIPLTIFLFLSYLPILRSTDIFTEFPYFLSTDQTNFFNMLINDYWQGTNYWQGTIYSVMVYYLSGYYLDLYISVCHILINSTFIIFSFYFIWQKEFNSQIPNKDKLAKINVLLSIISITLIPFSLPNIFFKLYYILAYFNATIAIFNILMTYVLFKLIKFRISSDIS
ncbi:MAG: hypothetical protein ACTSRG_12880 [Candidatus Helarchaeota archaeon]